MKGLGTLHCVLAPVPEQKHGTRGGGRHNSPLHEKKELVHCIRPEVQLAWYPLL